MEGAPIKAVNDAVTAMVDEMRIISGGMKPYFRLSIVKFGSTPLTISEALSEQAIDVPKVASLEGDSGTTDAAAALSCALSLLKKNGGKDTDFNPYVFFFSDGAPDDAAAALKAGSALKSLTIPAGSPRLVTIGVGAVQDDFMRELASTPELYKRLTNIKDIIRLFPTIGTIAASATGVASVDEAIMNI
jgi:Uncharacterized protein encoded in toxicity protection region of plasmid R478, contains von Willebrand factor (vWF) domain